MSYLLKNYPSSISITNYSQVQIVTTLLTSEHVEETRRVIVCNIFSIFSEFHETLPENSGEIFCILIACCETDYCCDISNRSIRYVLHEYDSVKVRIILSQ